MWKRRIQNMSILQITVQYQMLERPEHIVKIRSNAVNSRCTR